MELRSLKCIWVPCAQRYSLVEIPKSPRPPPAFGLIFEGAIGQPRLTTSLCDPLVSRYSTYKFNVLCLDLEARKYCNRWLQFFVTCTIPKSFLSTTRKVSNIKQLLTVSNAGGFPESRTEGPGQLGVRPPGPAQENSLASTTKKYNIYARNFTKKKYKQKKTGQRYYFSVLRIRDPVLCWPLDPWLVCSGSWIPNPYFWELVVTIFWVKSAINLCQWAQIFFCTCSVLKNKIIFNFVKCTVRQQIFLSPLLLLLGSGIRDE
jgi:hypothetical protein